MVRLPKLPKPIKKSEIKPRIPEGLDLRYIRSADGIPDKYIKDNYILNEFRKKKVVTQGDQYFLIGTLVKHLIEKVKGVDLNPNIRDDYEDEDDYYDDDDHLYKTANVTIAQLKEALEHIIASPILFELFDTAKVKWCDREGQGGEITLMKEKEIWDSDQVVISRLKRTVFNEITRCRRAKEKAW
jgi:hypothetical protein